MKTAIEITILEELSAIRRAINQQAERMFNYNESNRPLLTIKKVAEYSSMSEMFVYRAVEKGTLKPFKKTGKKLFKLENVNKWLRGA